MLYQVTWNVVSPVRYDQSRANRRFCRHKYAFHDISHLHSFHPNQLNEYDVKGRRYKYSNIYNIHIVDVHPANSLILFVIDI